MVGNSPCFPPEFLRQSGDKISGAAERALFFFGSPYEKAASGILIAGVLHLLLMKPYPALALSLALMLPAAMHAAFSYTVTDLGTLGGANAYAYAVNASGQVAGKAMNAAGTYRAFAWWKGTMIDLGTLGGTYSSATGINDQAQVVGESSTSGGATHAFVFSFSTGTMTDLGTLGGTYSTAAAINNHGIIVGTSTLGDGSDRAFAYVGGAMIDLGTLGGNSSKATAIDDSNVIVGTAARNVTLTLSDIFNEHGFVFINGSMLDLSALGGIFASPSNYPVFPNGVSDSGIAGIYVPDPLGGFGPAGFAYLGASTVSLGNSSTSTGSEYGINASGQVVGWYESIDPIHPTPQYASIYSGGVLYDLNTAVDLSGSDFTELTEATAISNNGYIVGIGTTTGGSTHAFLLTPIPPSS